jgi:hypothetical protein
MKPANITRETANRRREIASLDQEIGRLTEAIAPSSAPVPTLWRRYKRVSGGAMN